MMNTPLLEVSNLKKHYTRKEGIFTKGAAGTRAVDDVSFTICKGRVVGLVGESGCGKSTVGKLLLNLLSPDGGRVSYDGTVIFDVENKLSTSTRDMMALRQKMQIIFQDTASCLNPRKNIEQIISAGIRKHSGGSAEYIRQQCIEIMEQCGLDRRQMMRYPHEFSGGQRQRIGIARALAIHPEFLVCDEPTSALDVSVQSQILNLMLDLKEQMNLTYLFISHNLGVVEHFCDEIIIMYLGRIVEQGCCADIYRQPAHPYTRLLLESVPTTHPELVKEREPIVRGPSPAVGGCNFSNRCPYATESCRMKMPELLECQYGHFVACHHPHHI